MIEVRTFAQTLRQCRTEKNMTQSELARRLFVTPQSISKWERGEGMPDLENLCLLAQALSVSVDALLGRQGGSERTFIGVKDGSPVRCVLVNERGVVLNSAAEAINGGGVRDKVVTLCRCIDSLRPAAMNTQAIFMVRGAAEETEEDALLMLDMLQQRYPAIQVDSCSMIDAVQSSSGVPSRRALMVIGGRTSCVVYHYKEKGGFERTGRGGYLSRPNGSHYNIGHSALIAVCEEEEQVGEKTILTPLMLSWLGADKIKSQIPAFGRRGPGSIVALAHLVDLAARRGDKVALDILRKASADLVRLLRAARKKSPETDHVVLASTLYTATSDIFYELVRQQLEDEVTVVRLTTPLEWEACLRAAQMCGVGEQMALENFAKSDYDVGY